jgi:hypothetical protein
LALTDFILTEKLNHEHAERYLTYVDRYHQEVWTDLHKQLTAAWEAEIAKIIEAVDPIADMITKRELRVPGIISEIQLVTSPEKISTTRVRGWQQVSPSVKVPYVYHQETVDLILKRLLKTSEHVFEEIASKWSEIFNYEKKGQVQPGFRVELGDLHEGVKFKIISSIGGEEAYKTIYSVNIDHGRPESKIRSFDRVYLLSHV